MSRYYDTPSLWPMVKHSKPHNRSKVSKHGRGSYTSYPLASNTERGAFINAPFVSLVQGNYTSTAQLRRLSGGFVSAQNKALDKLYEEMNQASDLLVAWKERQTTIDMVTGAIRTLVRVARAVKRRDPRIVRAVLAKNPEAKDIVKTPAGLWLAYHFGIVPTVHDIHSALGLFSQEFPTCEFSHTSGADYTSIGPNNEDWDVRYHCRVKLGGYVSSINPHLNLAQRLGFGQPLSVIHEMTPFSWFIDYFTNVGQLVTNLEPRFPGFEFGGTYTTRRALYNAVYRVRSWGRSQESVQGRWYVRQPGWPNYVLEFKSPLDLKSQQCSYIAAVLVQLLTSMKPK